MITLHVAWPDHLTRIPGSFIGAAALQVLYHTTVIVICHASPAVARNPSCCCGALHNTPALLEAPHCPSYMLLELCMLPLQAVGSAPTTGETAIFKYGFSTSVRLALVNC